MGYIGLLDSCIEELMGMGAEYPDRREAVWIENKQGICHQPISSLLHKVFALLLKLERALCKFTFLQVLSRVNMPT